MKKMILVLLAVFFVAGTAHAAVYEFEPFDDLSSFKYSQDRFMPNVVESSFFDGDNRLHIGLAGTDLQSSSFYNYQGIAHNVNMPEYGYQSFSIDMYVGADWANQGVNTNAAMWGIGYDSTGARSAYPIVAFRDDGVDPAGFYTWDYVKGGWSLQSAAGAGDYGAWHTLRFDLLVGTGIEAFLNGQSLGLFADADTVDLGSVLLNMYNDGTDRDYYFDNFTAQATPIPGAVWLLGSGLVGLFGLRRKFL